MSQNIENLQIRIVIKNLLKKSGLQQKDLAAALDVSVPTVKRLLSGKELGLNRLIQIAGVFNLSVYELFGLCRGKDLGTFTFTSSQESFLARSIVHLVVFRSLLKGLKPEEVRSNYKLTNRQLEKILIGLDKVNLIEFWSNEKIRVKAKWPFKWIEGGTLEKSFLRPVLEKIFSASLERFANRVEKKPDFTSPEKTQENLFQPFELVLQDKTYHQMKTDLARVLDEYRSISKLEMAAFSPSTLRDVTGLLIVDGFSVWDMLFEK